MTSEENVVVTIDKVLTPDELAAIRQQLAGANWATGLSAGAQAALASHMNLSAIALVGNPNVGKSVLFHGSRAPTSIFQLPRHHHAASGRTIKVGPRRRCIDNHSHLIKISRT